MKSKTIELTPERWARVESLFDRAVQLPPTEREAFLQTSCADDLELCGYIVSLLQIDSGAAANDLEKTVVNALQSAIPGAMERQDEMEGSLLGPYRIIRTLGTGGMGVVYLAERADEHYEQRVAIKLGRLRLVDRESEQRLRSERQILANLDHPNIARLIDGGAADDGTPYIVMEYIDGVRIDTYCDKHRLTVGQRLDLFQSICTALHYAHQNLVVHRDIKPSNILVTDDGTPKLLDFGIAKLIDAQGAAAAGLTREGAVVMTPENAAPEQVLGQAITTATDTYALGLLLYSLLTGMPAYTLDGRMPSEMARIICQKTPDPPSVRIANAINAARRRHDQAFVEQIGRRRGTTTERLRRRLRGDLDTIILSALRKEPERRYRSVNQLGDDLLLHRDSKPIVARADSWSYRAGKFVRRHYAGVAMSVLMVVLLAAFGVTMSIQNKRIAAERDLAQQVSTFLEEIFRSPDPANTRGADVTAKEILQTGARRINRDLQDQPEIRATLMETIGRVYMHLADYTSSAEMLELSLELRQQLFGGTHASIATSKNELARTLIRQADYVRANALLQEALESNEADFGSRSPAVAENLFNLAEVHLQTGELNQAVEYARASIAIYSEHETDRAIELADANNVLARCFQLMGNLDESETHMREAIDIVREHGGIDHPLLAYYLQHLGVLLQSKGDIEGAEKALEQSVDATRRIWGDRHDLIGATRAIQGRLLHDKGDLKEAAAAFREALSIDRDARGAEHPHIGYDLTSLAMVLHDAGELAEAQDSLREALRIYELSLGEDHQYIASALTELGAVLTAGGNAKAAMPLLQRARQIRQKDYADDSPLMASTNTEYGNMLRGLGRYDEAEPLLLASYEVFKGQDNRRARRVKAAIGQLYEEWGKPERAATYKQ